jgi:hypothetical protein
MSTRSCGWPVPVAPASGSRSLPPAASTGATCPSPESGSGPTASCTSCAPPHRRGRRRPLLPHPRQGDPAHHRARPQADDTGGPAGRQRRRRDGAHGLAATGPAGRAGGQRRGRPLVAPRAGRRGRRDPGRTGHVAAVPAPPPHGRLTARRQQRAADRIVRRSLASLGSGGGVDDRWAMPRCLRGARQPTAATPADTPPIAASSSSANGRGPPFAPGPPVMDEPPDRTLRSATSPGPADADGVAEVLARNRAVGCRAA